MKIEYDEHQIPAEATSEIGMLLSKFYSNDGSERQKAREKLVKIGKSVSPSLIPLLSHSSRRIRWEACKTLEKIRDPLAAAALARVLLDDDMDVRWVAADALIELEFRAIPPVLEIIHLYYDSILLREAAHHVLFSLKEAGILDAETKIVLDALKSYDLPSKAAFAAIRALEARKAFVFEGERSP